MPSAGILLGATLAAGIPVEGIFYLIVFAFWVISRIAKTRRKSEDDSSPAQPAEGGGPRPVDQELKELFETITGQKLEPVRPPPPPPPSPPAQAPMAASRPASPKRPPRPARTRPVPSFNAPPPLPSAAMPVSNASLATPDPAAVAAFPTASRIGQFVRQTVVTTPVIQLPALKMGFSTSSTSSAAHLLTSLRSRQGMAEAIAQRAVLGPPRAFDPI